MGCCSCGCWMLLGWCCPSHRNFHFGNSFFFLDETDKADAEPGGKKRAANEKFRSCWIADGNKILLSFVCSPFSTFRSFSCIPRPTTLWTTTNDDDDDDNGDIHFFGCSFGLMWRCYPFSQGISISRAMITESVRGRWLLCGFPSIFISTRR